MMARFFSVRFMKIARFSEATLFSRRQFFKSGSVAVAAGAVLPRMAQAAETTEPLPPAITALHSMRAEAKPITIEERAARQEKARQLMRENNLSAILITQG